MKTVKKTFRLLFRFTWKAATITLKIAIVAFFLTTLGVYLKDSQKDQ